MEKYPPNIFKNKELLNQKLILEVKNDNIKMISEIIGYDNSSIKSHVRILGGNEEAINTFAKNLKIHKEESITIINEIENSLDNYLKNQNIGYIYTTKDLYQSLKKRMKILTSCNFSEVNKISHKVIRLIEKNRGRLNNIK